MCVVLLIDRIEKMRVALELEQPNTQTKRSGPRARGFSERRGEPSLRAESQAIQSRGRRIHANGCCARHHTRAPASPARPPGPTPPIEHLPQPFRMRVNL